MSRQLGLFGGTFDPIHLGHTRMANAFAAELNLDQVIFIPAGDPYHKEQITKTSTAQRLKMTQLATEENPLFSVSDCDITRQGKTYTVDTLLYFHTQLPELTEFWWLMGSDSLLQLHTWHQFSKLLTLANLAIAIRDNFKLEQIHPSLLPLCQNALEQDLVSEQIGGKMRLLSLPPLTISSKHIRDFAQEQHSLTSWLDPKVVQYINAQKLYQNN